MNSKELSVVTPNGEEGVIESLTISELDFIMVKVRYENRWVNYSIGKANEILKFKEIRLKDEETEYSEVVGI